jgi:hypothetical protein
MDPTLEEEEDTTVGLPWFPSTAAGMATAPEHVGGHADASYPLSLTSAAVF